MRRDGVHYHFVTREQFEEGIARGEFLEFATVFGKYYYGTPASEVEPYRAPRNGRHPRYRCAGGGADSLSLPGFILRLSRYPAGAYEARLRCTRHGDGRSDPRSARRPRAEVIRADEFDYRLVERRLGSGGPRVVRGDRASASRPSKKGDSLCSRT